MAVEDRKRMRQRKARNEFRKLEMIQRDEIISLKKNQLHTNFFHIRSTSIFQFCKNKRRYFNQSCHASSQY